MCSFLFFFSFLETIFVLAMCHVSIAFYKQASRLFFYCKNWSESNHRFFYQFSLHSPFLSFFRFIQQLSLLFKPFCVVASQQQQHMRGVVNSKKSSYTLIFFRKNPKKFPKIPKIKIKSKKSQKSKKSRKIPKNPNKSKKIQRNPKKSLERKGVVEKKDLMNAEKLLAKKRILLI